MKYYGHGKLLLSGEYVILDGALSLAVPTKLGQHLSIKESTGSEIVWKSLDRDDNVWFEAKFDLMGFDPISTSDEMIAMKLKKIFRAACKDNSDFLSKWKRYRVETKLEFPRDWGLGSSSTLIHCIAEWADAHPLMVFFNCEDGSGYDVACASSDGPLSYQLKGDEISYTPQQFNPSFKNKLYFIHLGQKADSSKAIKDYRKRVKANGAVKIISELTEKIIDAKKLSEFEEAIDEHENIISKLIDQQKVKDKLFSDYWGSMKSLGAWGGDFILASSEKSAEETKKYFSNKDFNVCIPYSDMVLDQ